MNDNDVGTIVCDEDEIVEAQVVSGIAYAKDEAKVTILGVADKPGIAASVFGPLAEANIDVDRCGVAVINADDCRPIGVGLCGKRRGQKQGQGGKIRKDH